MKERGEGEELSKSKLIQETEQLSVLEGNWERMLRNGS